jgi:DNA-binding PadR family transcriptional regulator
MRRGDVRALLLAGLLEGPAHGYELMRRLEEQSGRRWRPSPGSVYPQLQQLQDEGLVRAADQEGRRIYALTTEGEQQADRGVLEQLAATDNAGGSHRQLRDELHQLQMAARQVGMAGDDAQVEQAVGVVRTARQSLYRLLAEQ